MSLISEICREKGTTHNYVACRLSELFGAKVMHPSATIGEPVEGDGVGVAVAVRVLHSRRLGESKHLTGLDALARALARVGSIEQNIFLRVQATKAKRLIQLSEY